MPLLLLLFIGSGCAALIYEIVWFQLLQLVIGSSAVSLGVLLGTFMGGMCLGSLLLPRFVSPAASSAAGVRRARARHRRHRPADPAAAFRWSAASTRRGRGPGLAGLLRPRHHRRRLPAAADASDGRDAAGRRPLGRGHAAGRVLARDSFTAATSPARSSGCLLAGFYLLRVYDMAVATYVAVALNLLVAGLAVLHRATDAGFH